MSRILCLCHTCEWFLKMLGLYFYILIIGRKYCNMLNILNKLTLQKELQNCVINKCVFRQKVKAQQQNKTQTQKLLQEPGIEPGTFCTQSGCVTTALPSQLRISILVKLFNCFVAIDQNVNKQSRICGPHIFNIFFCNIFTCINNYIWQILIFTGVCFTA